MRFLSGRVRVHFWGKAGVLRQLDGGVKEIGKDIQKSAPQADLIGLSISRIL